MAKKKKKRRKKRKEIYRASTIWDTESLNKVHFTIYAILSNKFRLTNLKNGWKIEPGLRVLHWKLNSVQKKKKNAREHTRAKRNKLVAVSSRDSATWENIPLYVDWRTSCHTVRLWTLVRHFVTAAFKGPQYSLLCIYVQYLLYQRLRNIRKKKIESCCSSTAWFYYEIRFVKFPFIFRFQVEK